MLSPYKYPHIITFITTSTLLPTRLPPQSTPLTPSASPPPRWREKTLRSKQMDLTEDSLVRSEEAPPPVQQAGPGSRHNT